MQVVVSAIGRAVDPYVGGGCPGEPSTIEWGQHSEGGRGVPRVVQVQPGPIEGEGLDPLVDEGDAQR